MKRYKAKRSTDRRVFSKSAQYVNSKNVGASPMRGGYRF